MNNTNSLDTIIFSVIIPCYNSENTIERALDSVVNQTFNQFEIIIVDDGSIDNTKRIINSYFSVKNVQYKYIFQSNQGPSISRNRAVQNAKGKYIAFLDSDDEWHRDKLKIQYEYIQKYKVNFLSCQYTLDNLNEDLNEDLIKNYTFKDFLIKNRTSTPCTVVLKSIFDELGGFDETLKYSEDYNLWLKISLKYPLFSSSQRLVRLHKKAYGESGLSSHLWEMEKGELYNYKFLYKHNYIKFHRYLGLISISFLKYLIRRIKCV